MTDKETPDVSQSKGTPDVCRAFLPKSLETCEPSSVSSHLSNPRHHKDLVLSRKGTSWKARLERKEWVIVFRTESHESIELWKDFEMAR